MNLTKLAWGLIVLGLIMLGMAVCLSAPAQYPQVRARHGHEELRHDQTFVDYNGHRVRHREIVEIVSVAQINPAYVSAYSPEGYDGATQGAILAQIQQLSAQLQVLQAKLNAAPTQITPVVVVPPAKPGDAPTVVTPTPPPAPAKAPPLVQPVPGPDAALNILRTHCASCHQSGKLLPDQKFTLLDAKGDLVTLTDRQKLRLVQKTRTAQMPPPSNTYGIPSLSDVEFAAVADLMGQ